MPISVETYKYVSSHSRDPRGSGNWAFEIAGNVHWFRGLYSECKARAIKKANQLSTRAKPIFRIYVLP